MWHFSTDVELKWRGFWMLGSYCHVADFADVEGDGCWTFALLFHDGKMMISFSKLPPKTREYNHGDLGFHSDFFESMGALLFPFYY
ncbi:hypothetical protein ACH5RR_023083 [Cinchona calisaya]|uniref:F-box protein n=1 Tax=Cinchona calisaya TaxID=153742 RepID=A0ABD2Z9N0_9GENT